MDKLSLNAGKNIVDVCSRLMSNETATIVTDKETVNTIKVIKKFANEITQKVNLHVIEDYGERPLTFLPKEH